MDFGVLPPEIISGQMYSGPGSGPLVAAAAAWDGLATELQSTATAYNSAISALAESWQGPSASAMTAAATPYVAWISATAAQAKETATRATAAAGAYQDAFAATVPPPVIAVNRSRLAALTATNIFGQHTAAIAATEAQYAEMWLQNTATMYSYAAAAATATRGAPFTAPPQTTDPAASAAATGAQSGLIPQLLDDLASAAAQFNFKLAGADTFLGGLAGSSSASGLYEEAFGTLAAVGKMSTFANASMSVPNLGMVQFKTFFKPVVNMVDIPTSSLGAALHVGGPPVGSGLVGAVSAGAGEANLVGRLSVPPSWASATPAIRLAATGLPDSGPAAAPAADAAGSLLAPTALGSLAGGALGGSAPRLINATGAPGRSTAGKAGRSPVKLDRVIAQLQQRPNSVQHWNVDQAGLDDLIAELSKRPGVHAVHLSAGE
ncbi:MAG TPA: PPE family protein [Mycobacterium sp.]|nr:PPE family protein [Mycobacterium sp.]